MRSGTTLVEALVGLALVASALGAALTLSVETARAAHANEERTLARLALLEAMRLPDQPGIERREEPAGAPGLSRLALTVKTRDGAPVTLCRLVRRAP